MPVAITGELPVGIVAEHSLLTFVAQVVVAAAALLLLLAGRVFPRTVRGIFYLLLAWLVGFRFFAATGYLLVLLAALLLFGLGAALSLYWPRAAMAFAMLWPFPLLYVAHLNETGSFSPNFTLILAALVGGAALGALLPSASVALLAPALGTLAVGVFWQMNLGFNGLLSIFVTGVLWQLLVLPRLQTLVQWLAAHWPEPTANCAQQFRSLFLRGAAVSVGMMLAVALLVPHPQPEENQNPKRLQRLRAAGVFARPGLILSAANNYYVFGRPLPVAMVAPSPAVGQRFALLVLGKSPQAAIHRLRTIKEPAELAKLRQAAAITSAAFARIAPLIAPGRSEAEITQEIQNHLREQGAQAWAFRPIVAAGANAVRPHYSANRAVMRAGLVVIDIGASVDNYTSDMTRTFAVRGRFSPAERKLLDVLVAAVDSARAHLRPGVTLKDLHQRAAAVIAASGFGPFFNHSIGHHIGLEVHDPASDSLTAGMVITLEPGIYIPAGAAVDSSYWHLGARLEDTYLVTEQGNEMITHFPLICEAKQD